MLLSFKKLSHHAKTPTYGTEYSAGADLYSINQTDITIKPNETVFLGTGISLEIPQGYVGLIYARSGLACKKGLAPANKVGVIDSDYRGEIIITLHNHSDSEAVIGKHERIAQIVITPYVKCEFTEVDELNSTIRNAGGFGSTGK